MIVWINGTFGVGKSTTACNLRRLRPAIRYWDPEAVGLMLRTVVSDLAVKNFQDWSAWREVVVATGHAVGIQTGQDLVAPQTVLRQKYMDEIAEGFAAHAITLFHVLLDASADCLRERILNDADKVDAAWRLEHLAEYEAARPWMRQAADLVIDTSVCSAAEAAQKIVHAARL